MITVRVNRHCAVLNGSPRLTLPVAGYHGWHGDGAGRYCPAELALGAP